MSYDVTVDLNKLYRGLPFETDIASVPLLSVAVADETVSSDCDPPSKNCNVLDI